MDAMDAISLSLKMKRLIQWLDSRCEPDNRVRKRFRDLPFGNCYVTIDTYSPVPCAYGHLKRVTRFGTERGR